MVFANSVAVRLRIPHDKSNLITSYCSTCLINCHIVPFGITYHDTVGLTITTIITGFATYDGKVPSVSNENRWITV